MAGEFKAGSILIEFQTQAKLLEATIDKTQQKLDALGKGTVAAADKVQRGGSEVVSTFDKMEKASFKMASRVALMSQRLLGMSVVLQTINSAGAGGMGKFSAELETGVQALTAFGAIVSIFPNKLGVVVGILAALAVVIAKVTGATKEQTAAIEELEKANLAAGGAGRAVQDQRRFSQQKAELDKKLFNTVQDTLANETAALATALEERALLQANYDALVRKRISGISGAELEEVDRVLRTIAEQIEASDGQLPELHLRVNAEQAVTDVFKAQESITRSAEKAALKMSDALRLGLTTPLQAAEEAMKLAGERLLVLAEQQRGIQARLDTGRGLTDENRRNLRLALQTIGEEVTLATSSFMANQMKIAAIKAAEEFNRTVIQPLAQALGTAISSAILAGGSSMEILADLGKTLFTGWVNSVVTQFLSGMTAALQTIGGLAGSIFGALLQAAIGIAGFFIAQANQDDVTESFNAVQDAVTNTENVRGIVAGPTSVAIANVGDNLSRAMQPVQDTLLQQLGVLIQIRDKNGAGGGGGTSPRFAGAVPTA